MIATYAQAPPIHGSCVSRLEKHFWCEKFRCAAKCSCSITKSDAFFAQTKVGHFQIALCVQQQIVQLQVSVNNFVIVQELQAQHDTSGIEASTCLVENLLVYVHHEITTIGIFHHETNMLRRLKTSEQIDQKGMLTSIDYLEYALLTHQTLDFFAMQYVTFLQRFDCIILTRLFVLRQDHFAKMTTTQHAYETKRVHVD